MTVGPQEEKIPFGPEWQRLFAKLLVEDDNLAQVVGPHIEPKYFELEGAQWLWATYKSHSQRYGGPPSWMALREQARRMDPSVRDTYVLAVEQIQNTATQDEHWVRDGAVEWVRRNVFARAWHSTRDIFNSRGVDAAYDELMGQLAPFNEIITGESITESWHFEELQARQARRWESQMHSTMTGTGIPELDHLLGGGVEKGTLNLAMAYSKVGKTTWLINLGRVATRAYHRKVAHFYFEGTADQIQNRYDASFSAELYNAVKRGEMGSERYKALFDEYSYLRGLLYIRGFTDNWSYTIEDVWEALERLRRKWGWDPDVLILDYLDLIKGRGTYRNDLDSNAAAYRDGKTLSTKRQGYAIWSAAQATKPQDDAYDTRPHVLKSPNLGGRYEKVKVADLLLSLNATLDERVAGWMRLWVEAVRDNPAGREITIPCEFDKMLFGAGARGSTGPTPNQAPPPSPAGMIPLGYRQMQPQYAAA